MLMLVKFPLERMEFLWTGGNPMETKPVVGYDCVSCSESMRRRGF